MSSFSIRLEKWSISHCSTSGFPRFSSLLSPSGTYWLSSALMRGSGGADASGGSTDVASAGRGEDASGAGEAAPPRQEQPARSASRAIAVRRGTGDQSNRRARGAARGEQRPSLDDANRTEPLSASSRARATECRIKERNACNSLHCGKPRSLVNRLPRSCSRIFLPDLTLLRGIRDEKLAQPGYGNHEFQAGR